MTISDMMRGKIAENISLFVCLSFAFLWLATPTNFICLSFAKGQSDSAIISNICRKQDETTCSLFACHLPKWHEIIKTGNGGGFVFDCRAMPNPYWDESLRGYTGRDKPIVEFFDRIPTRSVYFAERMAERLAGTDGVTIEVTHAAKPFWKVKGDKS